MSLFLEHQGDTSTLLRASLQPRKPIFFFSDFTKSQFCKENRKFPLDAKIFINQPTKMLAAFNGHCGTSGTRLCSVGFPASEAD